MSPGSGIRKTLVNVNFVLALVFLESTMDSVMLFSKHAVEMRLLPTLIRGAFVKG